ncbi:MAG: acetate/propionate family kinase [Myxococcota bacterium]
MNVLVLNSGSSSVKYQVIDTATSAVRLVGLIERVGKDVTYAQALAQVLEAAKHLTLDAVGHRVVHGGERFVDATRIDDAVEQGIEACIPLAPLHNPPNLAGIRAARAALPGLPQVAVFDTAFHARLPRRARTFAIDQAVAQKHGLRRYGFHGTSHQYVAQLAAQHLGRPLQELRLVTLHLGNGASATAVEFGVSTETSMGLTPLDGLVMGTRGGDLDPGVLLALLRTGEFDAQSLDRLLNHQSGLAGLSGLGNDLRDIEQRASEGDDRCRLAVSVFAHRARKYLGAYAAVMGGLDAVVLTGGIGENAVAMRRRILQRLDFLGLVLDDEANEAAKVSAEQPVAAVSAPNSRVAALVVKTNEELSIARQTAALVEQKTSVKPARNIPIAISARHVHLDQATFEKLFGAGATLTRLRDISQPGQFASEQKVNVVGPRNRLDGVRVLGPLRPASQVEVSRSDEFFLGVDAPIRDSGNTQGSAPITLEGPKGTVQLAEGLICAKRHIHMTPDDATAFGVSDGDEVEVAITGGPRDLVFGDVLVRVSPKYRLEMHLDTDEANAAELSQGAVGEVTYTDVLGASGRLQKRRA